MTFEEIAPLFNKPTKNELTLYRLRKRIRLLREDIATTTNKPEVYQWYEVCYLLDDLLNEDKD